MRSTLTQHASWIPLCCLLSALVATPAIAQAVEPTPGEIEPIEEETPAEESGTTTEEPETNVDETVPPSYTPPGVSFRSVIPGAGEVPGPPLPNTDDLPTIDPEIFFDPSKLPGPLPPPPSVAVNRKPGSKFADIQADLIIQDRVEELVTLEGNVIVVYEDTTIRAANGFLNEKDEVAAFWGEGGVEVEAEDGTLNTEDLTLEFAEDVKKMTAVGSVKALMYAKTKKDFGPKPTKRQKLENAFRERETTLTGDNFDYWWGTKEFHLWVNDENPAVATITQKGRTAQARDIHYAKTPDEGVRMTGNVELWQENGQWLYDHDLIEKKDSKVLKALMAVASTLNCDSLDHSETTKITKLDGDVRWKQEDKDARADSVLIDDSPRVWEDPADADMPPAIINVGLAVEEITPEEVLRRGIEWKPGALVDEDGNPPEDLADLEKIPASEYGGQVLIAKGAVYGQQKNGDWLFKYEVIEPDEDEKVKEDAAKPAEGWAEEVILRLDTEDLDATGNVRIKQPHQWGRADQIGYRKEADKLTLTGEVQVRRRDKQMVLADLGFLHLTSDVFEAFGHVESSAIINTDDQKPSDTDGGMTLLPMPIESDHVLQDPNAPPPAAADPSAAPGTPPADGAANPEAKKDAAADGEKPAGTLEPAAPKADQKEKEADDKEKETGKKTDEAADEETTEDEAANDKGAEDASDDEESSDDE